MMKLVSRITLMAVLVAAGVGSVSVYADESDVVYRFTYAFSYHDGRRVGIIGPVIELDRNDNHGGLENQWHDWLAAYAEELSGIPSWEFSHGALGLSSTRSETERKRREEIGSMRSKDFDEVFETSRLQVPEFRYYPD